MRVGGLLRLFFSLSMLLNASESLATSPTRCADLFQNFANIKVLKPSLDRVRLPVEVKVGGQVLKRDRLIELSDILHKQGNGDYLYLLTQDGTLAFGLRNQGSFENDQYLLGHPSLLELLKTEQADTQVVAAGEWIVRNGRLSIINNESGTFKPGPETLEGVMEFLSPPIASLGRPILERAKLDRALKPRSSPVLRAFYDALSESAEFQSRTQAWAELYSAMAQRFPSAEAPGWFDSAATKVILVKLNQDALSSSNAVIGILHDVNREGLGFALFHPLRPVELLGSNPVEKAHGHLQTLDELLKSGWELVRRFDGV
jgi:hypothetical protein